jgi:prepilin-type N-terminal cleavage/methylation domain-containing protein
MLKVDKLKGFGTPKYRIQGVKGSRGQVKTSENINSNPRILEPLDPSGMTLIEVIVVMIIIGILAAIVLPKIDFGGTSSMASVDGAANMIASDIRYTQECAMATRASKTITFSAGGNSYSFNPTNNLDPTGRLPYGVTTTALTLTFNSLGEPTSIPAISPYYVDLTVLGGGLTKTTRIWCFTGKVAIL